MQIFVAKLTRRNGKEREREEWERFGHSEVALRIDV
jgi:hypothetical protein